MLRIDIKPENVEKVSKLLCRLWSELDLDWENKDTGFNEYWTSPYLSDLSDIEEAHPNIDWDNLADDYDIHVSIEQAINYNLDELEKRGLLKFNICTDCAIYFDRTSYPIKDNFKIEPFKEQELVDMYYKFENNEDISELVINYLKENE